MSRNPYQPPQHDLAPSDPVLDSAGELPPRYRGTVQTVRGEVDPQEAIQLAKACRPIAVSTDVPSAKPKSQFMTVLIVALVLGTTLILFFLDAAPPQKGQPPAVSMGSAGWLMMILIPIVLVVGLLLLFSAKRSRFSKADPPLDGKTTFRVNPLGCSIEKATLDQRVIEVFCSWRQTTVSESEDAWLLNVGMVNPFLIVKSWLTDEVERNELESFFRELARWRSTQTPQLDFRSVPDEASESFPDYLSGATRLTVSSTTEKRARLSLVSRLRQDLPEYRASPRRWFRPIGYMTLAVLTMAAIGLLLRFPWSEIDSQWGQLLMAEVPLIAFIFFGIRIAMATGREIQIDAALTDHDLWYDYRAILLRMPLDSFPIRRRVDENIVFATPSGSTTIVLPADHFESDEAFSDVAERLSHLS